MRRSMLCAPSRLPHHVSHPEHQDRQVDEGMKRDRRAVHPIAQAAQWQDPERQSLAALDPDRGCPGGRTHQAHLPVRAIPPPRCPAGREASCGRGRSYHSRHRLSPAPRGGRLPRSRGALLRRTGPAGGRTSARRSPRGTRRQGHPRAGSLTVDGVGPRRAGSSMEPVLPPTTPARSIEPRTPPRGDLRATSSEYSGRGRPRPLAGSPRCQAQRQWPARAVQADPLVQRTVSMSVISSHGIPAASREKRIAFPGSTPPAMT